MIERDDQVGTRIPRWTIAGADPGAGFVCHQAALPSELCAALRRLASGQAVGLDALLLAAHLKVLSSVSSERTLLTGYRPRAALLRCRAAVSDAAWQELIAEASRAGATAEPCPAGADETVLDLTGLGAAPIAADEPDRAIALQTAYAGSGRDLRLRLAGRRDVLGGDFVERLAGYHLAALRLMTADPTARHERQSLLSEAELVRQCHDLAGPRRRLPETLFVEQFEEQAARRPSQIAAWHGQRRWSYRELNRRANRVAHRLLERGLLGEDVVAVVTERDLDWLAAVLGVLKAGGVYLPIRPDFPSDRVARQLERSDCRYAIVAPAGEAAVEAALQQAGRASATARIEAAGRDRGRDDNPGVAIRPDQLAYIYFTSGSTGTPKGAMCEHAGMLNHLYAKVEDMQLRAGEVVAQLASQCFDISLWQLAAPLLVGGATAIVETEVQLDVDRFLDRLACGGIQVVQVVPAYLDVMLSRLEQRRRPLGDLRSVSVTGQALKISLVRRWFALYPDVTLVNAYGATEVSDDTMHERLDRPPAREFVSVGRSLRNVNTYVLDEHQRLVPLGAPGEIAFSGVCVGRGYINDPERTRQAFTSDPYRAGTRLYRTGDFGRWLPEGTIEFLGRRDEQVKIRGYRIEIGEVENRLLQLPCVREAAVVVDGASEQTRNLAAFFVGSDELSPAGLRDSLAARLPDYMVPASFRRLDALPLTENGKINKRLLVELTGAAEPGANGHQPPATPTERRLATAWAEVLNVPVGRIGRSDDFFGLGGSSLAAVLLVAKLDRLVPLRQLMAHPVLRELATVIDAAAPAAAADHPVPDPTAAGPHAPALLQRLSGPDVRPAAILICFPYAGGNALNFQLLARELERADVAVYAVELPGHDVALADEPLADVAEVAARVHLDLRALATGPILLWGHCAGAAYALALARLLEEDGQPPARILLGAILLDEPADLRREIEEISALSNHDITARLRDDGAYIEPDLLKSERSEVVGRAFKHDVCSTNRYLIGVQEEPAHRRLRAPIEVVVGADDPTTAGAGQRYRRWGRVGDTVTVHTLAEGGHYFVRSRPADVAALVAAACLAEPAG